MTHSPPARSRFAWPRMIATMVVLGVAAQAAAEWPSFGGAKQDENVQPTSVESPAEAASEESAMIDSPAFKIAWPKIEMPKFSWKPGFGGGDKGPAAARENPVSQTLDKVSSASKRAANGVRDAWGSAVSKLSFGGGQSAPNGGEEKQGWLARMFGPSQEEPTGAETVQEFLAQDRPGTTRR